MITTKVEAIDRPLVLRVAGKLLLARSYDVLPDGSRRVQLVGTGPEVLVAATAGFELLPEPGCWMNVTAHLEPKHKTLKA
jgi:hypothetical protein